MEQLLPPIQKVIEHYGGRVREGYMSWQKIKCPFHSDNHASAGVSLHENIFVCHGCGIKGNGFNVIKEYEGVTFLESIKIAENITGEIYKPLRGASALGRRVSGKARIQSRSSNKDSIRSRR
jgi:DNA primase